MVKEEDRRTGAFGPACETGGRIEWRLLEDDMMARLNRIIVCRAVDRDIALGQRVM